jgi:hypothetical protein
MATVLSNILTDKENLDVQIQAGVFNTKEKVIICEYTAAGVIADNDVIVLAEIPSNAKITSVRFWADDLGTTGDLNLGFYPGSGVASDIVIGDALDEDALALAVDVNAAVNANVELRFHTANITTASSKVWELAGLSSVPDYSHILLALTASEATTAGGDISVIVRYTEQ